MNETNLFLKSGTFTAKKYNRILIASAGSWMVALIDSCADTILAGAFLDELAVSAVSLVQPISSVVSFFAYLVSVGTAILFSRECGAFRREKAYQYVGQGIICSVAISVLLVVLMALFRDSLMAFYGASEEITALAREYYMCEIFFAAVYPIYFLVYQLVMVDGDEVFSLLACIAGAGGNLIASALLVGPFGISGLAYGTIIGTVAGLAVYCIHFLRRTNSVRARAYFNLRELGGIVKISSSTSMTLLYVALIDIIMNKFVISSFGDEYLPAYAVVNFMLNLGAIFCSLYDAGSGFISVAYGENNPEGIKRTMRIACRSLVIFSVAVMVILELLSPYAPDLYSITDPAVRGASVFAARAISLSCPALAVYYLFCTYYPTVGREWLGHILSGLYMMILPLAMALPLGLILDFNGLSIGFALTSPVAEIITALVIWARFGKKAVPMALEDTEEESLFYDLRLSPDSIAALCQTVCNELKERNVPAEVSNEVQLILEDGYMTIMEMNPGKKVLTECDILISPKALRLITRDNGCIFDITDPDAKVRGLRSYLLARLMARNTERSNTTTVSFNRNSYLWPLQE